MASTDFGRIHMNLSDVNYSSRSKQVENETYFDASAVCLQVRRLRFSTNVSTCTSAYCLHQRWAEGDVKKSPNEHTRDTLVSKLWVRHRNYFSCIHLKPEFRQAKSKTMF